MTAMDMLRRSNIPWKKSARELKTFLIIKIKIHVQAFSSKVKPQ